MFLRPLLTYCESAPHTSQPLVLFSSFQHATRAGVLPCVRTLVVSILCVPLACMHACAQVRRSYLAQEIYWGHVFARILRPAAAGETQYAVDIAR